MYVFSHTVHSVENSKDHILGEFWHNITTHTNQPNTKKATKWEYTE